MKLAPSILVCLAINFVLAQQVGKNTPEFHPKITTRRCDTNGCTSRNSEVVLDANWRWLHNKDGYDNCFGPSGFDKKLCPNGKTCAQNCALEGVSSADYKKTYGITTSGDALTLSYVTGSNVGSRVFLMRNDSHYELFKLKNQEFSVDIDISELPCGLNGALYFSEMDVQGGKRFSGNKAGAKYGTGYCDAQCPHDIKYISGEANSEGWKDGHGKYGSCCNEMDIVEANSQAMAFTPHPCTKNGPYRCLGDDCGDGNNRYGGVCDKDGCDYNSYRQGDKGFFGLGKDVNTKKKITVVTRFITSDGTSSGDLVEIKRLYVQGGKVIYNAPSKVDGIPHNNSLTDRFCAVQKKVFKNQNDFARKGGMKEMGDALKRGMVLVLSIWDDGASRMLWLDSNTPEDASPSDPGVARGPCPTSSGNPSDLRPKYGSASVTFSNIRWGKIGTTTKSGPSPTKNNPTRKNPTQTKTKPTKPSGSCSPLYGQCGGKDWNGPTCCSQGSCESQNECERIPPSSFFNSFSPSPIIGYSQCN